jgi:hypothetical protein
MDDEELNETTQEEPTSGEGTTTEDPTPVDPVLAQMIALVKVFSDETNDSVISAVITFAGDKVYRYGDPYQTMQQSDFLAKYTDVVVDAAAYMLNKRGWDYQSAYTENGVRREYETGDLPKSILNRITPIAKVAKV